MRLSQLEATNTKLGAVSQEAIGLIGARSTTELLDWALELAASRLRADAALYIHALQGPGLTLRGSKPDGFASLLKTDWDCRGSPLGSGPLGASSGPETVQCCSQKGKLEGCLVLQRNGTPGRQAEPFSPFDRITTSILGSAIAYALRKLRTHSALRSRA